MGKIRRKSEKLFVYNKNANKVSIDKDYMQFLYISYAYNKKAFSLVAQNTFNNTST